MGIPLKPGLHDLVFEQGVELDARAKKLDTEAGSAHDDGHFHGGRAVGARETLGRGAGVVGVHVHAGVADVDVAGQDLVDV